MLLLEIRIPYKGPLKYTQTQKNTIKTINHPNCLFPIWLMHGYLHVYLITFVNVFPMRYEAAFVFV